MKPSFRLGVYKNWRGVWGVSEGELKKRILPIVRVMDVGEESIIMSYGIKLKKRIHDNENKVNKIIDEVKKDMENEACFEVYAYSLTESEESVIVPLKIWKKYFGD